MKAITTIKLSKKTAELLNKLKIHPRQAYEEVILKLLKKAKLDRKTNKKGHYGIMLPLFLLIIGMILILGLFLIKGGIIGQVVFSEANNYAQQLNLEVNENYEYLWVLEKPGRLEGVKLSGFFEQNTSAKVYLEHKNKKYLILNTDELNKYSRITSSVTKKNKKIKVDSDINETTISSNKTISVDLEYKSGTIYDENNDGIETTNGVVDLTIEDTQFNLDFNEENLCTRWNVYSVEDDENTIVCYGSSKCCSFVDLPAARTDWDEPFYSAYGQYGATFNNIISAQVLYVDYNLSIEDPFAEIYYSNWDNLSVNYYESTISFEDICVESCFLENFNEKEYRLIFEVDNGFLQINTASYTVTEKQDKIKVNLKVIDNNGDISGDYRLYKDNIIISEKFVEPGYYDIEAIPQENIIDKLVINKININHPRAKKIGIDKVSREISIDDVGVKKKYAIDTSEIEFETAILTATAEANSLYECNLWDYESEICFGTWDKVKDLIVGEEYELALAADGLGFIEGDSINVTERETKDCSNFIKTDDGQFYCEDDKRFYSCQGFENIDTGDADIGDSTRCTRAVYLRDTVSSSMCPFKHKDCNVTVDQDKGWGARQSVQKSKYKLSTFSSNFYCGGGHCEVPFFFKSNASVSGELDFNVTADLLLSNISIKRVLKNGIEVDIGNEVSMKQHDSYYYIASFDYESEWTAPSGIRTRKPVKFNISASLDGEKILELDPVGFESYNTDSSTDIRDVAIPAIPITCNSGDILIVGVGLETGSTGGVTVDYNGIALDSINFSQINSFDLEMFNLSNSPECSGSSKNVNVAVSGGGNGKEAIAMVSVYSGADTVDMSTVSNLSTSAAQISNTVTTAASGDFAVDVVAYQDGAGDSSIDADGDNNLFERSSLNGEDTGGLITGMSDDDGLIGGAVTLSWSSQSSGWISIGVALVATPVAPDTTPPEINVTFNQSFTNMRINDIINVSANATDVGGGLALGFIGHNMSGELINYTFTLSGEAQNFSQNFTINLTRGNVINFSVVVNDTASPPNQATNDTIITVANTPAGNATIVFPPFNDFKTNIQPLDLNVTYPADPDNDVINITYYIDGKLNTTEIEFNTTFNASDGVYILNISLHDNVTPIEYSANISINFTIDTTVPVVNGTLNESLTNIGLGDVINLSANATDNIDLDFGQIIINASPAGSELIRYFNFTFSGKEDDGNFSQNITIDCNGGCVINFTVRVNDTAGNFRTNDTIVTVVDKKSPVVNTSLNKSLTNIAENDIINISANITDNIQLLSANITYNMSAVTDGPGILTKINFTLSGTEASVHNVTEITCGTGCVINFTVYATDTSNNVKQNSTVITVVVDPATVPLSTFVLLFRFPPTVAVEVSFIITVKLITLPGCKSIVKFWLH